VGGALRGAYQGMKQGWDQSGVPLLGPDVDQFIKTHNNIEAAIQNIRDPNLKYVLTHAFQKFTAQVENIFSRTHKERV